MFDKQGILAELKRRSLRPMGLPELMNLLSIAKSKKSLFKKVIKELVLDGELIKLKGHRYGFPSMLNLVTGRAVGHPDGYGFIVPEGSTGKAGGEDVWLSPRKFREVMHGDLVVVRVESAAGERKEGSVVRILDRAVKKVVGIFDPEDKGRFVIPFERKINQDIYIPRDYTMGAERGQAVVAEIIKYPSRYSNPEGKIIEILGDPDEAAVELRIILRKYELSEEFSPEAVAQADKIFPPADTDIPGRLDLRNELIITIDGETAKDFDDAISIDPLPGGKWRLGVHIADVSHYVTSNSPLDTDAFARGTSVYFPGSVIPMLPHRLSSDICSLKPDVDRLTMSAIMELSPEGKVEKYEIHDSVIRSRYRMTYTDVAAMIDPPADGEPDKNLIAKYKDLYPKLGQMRDLALILNADRVRAGSIDFDLPEPDVILDLQGKPEDIVKSERNMAHRLIEEFMLLANKVVAEHIFKSGLPGIYRVHEPPDPMKLERFREFAESLGYKIPGGKKESKSLGPKDLQAILAQAHGTTHERLLTFVALRSMKQAVYTAEHAGHYGLAFDFYTHFTSPIRRYPDLTVHRLLKDIIAMKEKAGTKPLTMPAGEWRARMPEIAAESSRLERRADEAEREIVDMKKCQFMSNKIGNQYDGFISGVTAFGIFVELADYFLEGLIRVSQLKDDYYIFDEDRHQLRGHSSGKTYRLGDPVTIKVINVSLASRHIDFDIAGKGKQNEKSFGPAMEYRQKHKTRPAFKDGGGAGRGGGRNSGGGRGANKHGGGKHAGGKKGKFKPGRKKR